jgi:hypothetical protein
MGNAPVQLPVARPERGPLARTPMELCIRRDGNARVCRLYRLFHDAATHTYHATHVDVDDIAAVEDEHPRITATAAPQPHTVWRAHWRAMHADLRGTEPLARADGRAWDVPGGRVYRFDDAENAVFLWEPREWPSPAAENNRFPRRVPAGLGDAWEWLRGGRLCPYCQALPLWTPALPCGHRDACAACLRWAADTWTNPYLPAYPAAALSRDPEPGWRCRACPPDTPRTTVAALRALLAADAARAADGPAPKRPRTDAAERGARWRVLHRGRALVAVAPGQDDDGGGGAPVRGARSLALRGAPGLTLWRPAPPGADEDDAAVAARDDVWLREAAAGAVTGAFGAEATCPDYVPALLWLLQHAPPACTLCYLAPEDAAIGCGHRMCTACVVQQVERNFPPCTLCNWENALPEDVFPLRRAAARSLAWAEADAAGAATVEGDAGPTRAQQRALYRRARDTLHRSAGIERRVAYAGYGDDPDPGPPPAPVQRPASEDSDEDDFDEFAAADDDGADVLTLWAVLRWVSNVSQFLADYRRARWGYNDLERARFFLALRTPDREGALAHWLLSEMYHVVDENSRGLSLDEGHAFPHVIAITRDPARRRVIHRWGQFTEDLAHLRVRTDEARMLRTLLGWIVRGPQPAITVPFWYNRSVYSQFPIVLTLLRLVEPLPRDAPAEAEADAAASAEHRVWASLPQNIRELAVNDGEEPDDTRRAYATVYVVLHWSGCRSLPWQRPDIIGLIAQRLNATDGALFGPTPSWVRLDGILRSSPPEPDPGPPPASPERSLVRVDSDDFTDFTDEDDDDDDDDDDSDDDSRGVTRRASPETLWNVLRWASDMGLFLAEYRRSRWNYDDIALANHILLRTGECYATLRNWLVSEIYHLVDEDRRALPLNQAVVDAAWSIARRDRARVINRWYSFQERLARGVEARHNEVGMLRMLLGWIVRSRQPAVTLPFAHNRDVYAQFPIVLTLLRLVEPLPRGAPGEAAASAANAERNVWMSLPENVRENAVRFANDAFPNPDDTRRAYATVYVALDRAGCDHLPWGQPDFIGLIAQRLNATDGALLGPVPSWVRLDGMLRSPPTQRG